MISRSGSFTIPLLAAGEDLVPVRSSAQPASLRPVYENPVGLDGWHELDIQQLHRG